MVKPTDILSAMNRPSHWDGWVPTFTGTGFRPFSVEPGVVVPKDIAYGLAHTFRYGGQSDPAITVAEHSLLVASIVTTLWPDEKHLIPAALLHDAVEAYLHDVQAPLRRHIVIRSPGSGETGWNDNDRRVTRHIVAALGFDPDTLDAPEVVAADVLAASYEQRDCRNLKGDWGLPPIPAEVAHLKMRFDSPDPAEERFVAALRGIGISDVSSVLNRTAGF